MIQSLDLSQNMGIGNSELNQLTQLMINLGKNHSSIALRNLNLSAIGASPSSLCNFIQAIPQMPSFNSLDLSGNDIPFFCADALVSALKELEKTPVKKK